MMRDMDFMFLFAFIKRAGMYTASSEEFGFKGVGTFLYAYELGSDGKCDFIRHLIQKITEKYNAHPHNGGIEFQLKESAEELGLEWHKMFQVAAHETLVDLSDAGGQNRFVKLIRKQLLRNLRIRNIGNKIQDSWVINWHHTSDQIKDWKGVNISPEEKANYESLMDNMKSLTSRKINSSEIEITAEIKRQISDLIKLVEINIDK